ncbi:MAG: hypothetical protein RIB32_00530 [Phycisphaerales bacterium]
MVIGFVVTLAQSGLSFWPLATAVFGGFILLFGFMLLAFRADAKGRALEFDDRSQILILKNARFYRSFCDVRRKKRVEIPYGDIQFVDVRTHKGNSRICVATRTGRFSLSEYFERFDELAARLRQLASEEGERPVVDRWWFPLALNLVAALIVVLALLVGWIFINP